MTDPQPQHGDSSETEHDEAALRDAERKMRGGDEVEEDEDDEKAGEEGHDEAALDDAERKMRDMPS